MLRTLLTFALAFSSVVQQPARDSAAIRQTIIGTASISGLVTAGDDALTPIRRAVVTLTSADGTDARSAITGDDGRFTIDGVPAGRYTLEAEKPAHLTMMYGSRRPGRPGTALIITDGQQMRDIRLALPRGGILAGRLTFEDGQPVPNVQVLAIPARLAAAGGTPPLAAREFRTDDNGDFRIYGLSPDTYFVGAVPQFGRGEIERRTVAEYDALVRMLEQPTPPGTAANARAPMLPPALPVGFAPTYYPGTPSVSDAQPIVLRTGDVRDDLSFTIALAPVATIRGIVTGTNGQPMQAATISVEPIGPPLPFAAASSPRINRPNATGEYSITGMAPGRYVLRARAGGVTLGADPGSFP